MSGVSIFTVGPRSLRPPGNPPNTKNITTTTKRPPTISASIVFPPPPLLSSAIEFSLGNARREPASLSFVSRETAAPTLVAEASLFVVAVFRRDPAFEITGRRHADDVVSGIDEVDFARHSGRELRQKIQRRATDMVELDVLLQRAVRLVPFEYQPRVADGRSC